jgi:biopolymer transport protein ExbD
MRKDLVILIIILMWGCTNQEVKLPLSAEPGVHNIQNHSQVWLFFEVRYGDTLARVNRKNTISATHWIYNIDKRLKLKSIIPKLTKLTDTHRNSIHSKEGMLDYFSYADTLSNHVALIAFDKVIYHQDQNDSKDGEQDSATWVNINRSRLTVTADGLYYNSKPVQKVNLESYLSAVAESLENTKTLELQLYFCKELTYGDYLYYKTLLQRLSIDKFSISPHEYIIENNLPR